MLISLIRREILDNLMTFRFAAATLITLLLVVANTVVLVKDFDRRLASYNTAVKTHRQKLRETKTYSAGEIRVDRPPNPLSIFNVGFDKRLGNEIWIYHAFVPTLWDAEMSGSDNPFLNIFTSIDVSFIFEVVLSLMALMFAYDALAGERERGTLRLVLTHSVSRGTILLAKYVGAMLCLLIPLALSLILSLILLTTNASFSLGTPDFLRIGGFVLASLSYLSVFYLIGLLISAATQRTSTALMISMFVWGFLVLVYPNMILATIKPSAQLQTRAESAVDEMKQTWDEFDRERKRFLANDAVPGEDWSFGMVGIGGLMESFESSDVGYYYHSYIDFEGLYEEFEPQVPHAQKYFSYLGPRVVNTAERTWLVRKPVLDNIFVKPANSERTLLKFSPVGVYDAATQRLAGTDLLGIRDFFDAARQYRQTAIDYFINNDTFGSLQWFSADKGAADWTTLPQFSFQRADFGANAKRALPDFCLLLITNLALFMAMFLIFRKSEV
ncbi:MAG: ABC transporter permease subunit [Candidatus Poribacteria bacterium]|nr:ABC transporter permease subunit [Candidatus Poribacteria bacterium]